MSFVITRGKTFAGAEKVTPTKLNELGLPALTQDSQTLLGRNTSGNGATEELTPAQVRSILALVVGTNVQAYSGNLDTFAGISPSANVQSVLSAADYAAIRSLLGLVIGTNVQAYSANLGTFAGISPSANVQSVLSAADYAAVRALLIPGFKEAIDGSQNGWSGFGSGGPLRTSRNSTALADAIVFYNPNGNVGAIYTDGVTTTFNTTSDRRLKRAIRMAESCGAKIDRVKVREFEFKKQPGRKHRGFIAQELVRQFPEAVVRGGRRRTWMVDNSKLVPALVQEIQALRRRVAKLEHKRK